MSEWIEEFDWDNNSFWTLESAYPKDDGSEPICFCLRQALMNNEVVWYEDHDSELMGFEHKETWTSIEEAKAAIEQSNEVLEASMFDDPVSFALYRAEELHEKQETRKREIETFHQTLKREMDDSVKRWQRTVRGIP